MLFFWATMKTSHQQCWQPPQGCMITPREQILSMECSGKGPCWVHLAQGKHNTEEVDIMANKFHAPCPVQSDWIPAAPRENPNCRDFSAPRENRQHSLHWGHTDCPDLSVALSRALTARLPHPHLNNENGMVLDFQSRLNSQGKCDRNTNTAAKLYELSLENR